LASKKLRIDQYPTILYNANLNPLGIPESVKKAISENIDSITKYPDMYYNNLKNAVADYTGMALDKIVMGNGSSDLYKLYAALVMPKKALILSPGPMEYEKVLKSYGCEVNYYDLSEDSEFVLDVEDFISRLDDSLDIIMISNPNNPTSKVLPLSDIKKLIEACKEKNIFLIIDEMYIEFVDDYKDYTAISLTEEYSNMAVIRSVSKFFSVPGLRFAYAVMNNSELMELVDITTTKNNIASLTALGCAAMFKDEKYIAEGQSIIHTERSLVYLAMSTSKNIKLFKPDANYMLVKLLGDDVTSSTVADHCNQRGIIIRRCDNIRGLSEKYIRFCFMNPKQNDLMVNTILEVV
jgi:Histidinol-phosphate/aromatic aminotransferase and cobyric acid decarboxylase